MTFLAHLPQFSLSLRNFFTWRSFMFAIVSRPYLSTYVVKKNCASVLNQPRASVEELQRKRSGGKVGTNGEERRSKRSAAKVERLEGNDGGRGARELGSRRTINHAVMACSHVHVNLNRERAVHAASLSAVWEFDALRSKVYICICHSISIRALGIHPVVVYPRASLVVPAALENSLVVSQIDIVRRAKVRRCPWQALAGILCALHVVVCGVAQRCAPIRAESSRNTALDALNPP